MKQNFPVCVLPSDAGSLSFILSCTGFLSDPAFVGSAYIQESLPKGNPVGDDDKIYFFFSEAGKEFDFFDNTIVSRIARVCKVRDAPRREGLFFLPPWATSTHPSPHASIRALCFPSAVCSVWCKGRQSESLWQHKYDACGSKSFWPVKQSLSLQKSIPLACFSLSDSFFFLWSFSSIGSYHVSPNICVRTGVSSQLEMV